MVLSTATFSLTTLFFIALFVVYAQPQVPCVFFFGDSFFDSGSNNVLATMAKANYPPYGIDYVDGPTGRFSNGPIVPDYLAQMVGSRNPIPSYASTFDDSNNITNGVNYASGGAGILDTTGKLLGTHFSMNAQLFNHERVINRIASIRGCNMSSVKNNELTKCLYVISIGTNDYLNFLPLSSPTRSIPPERQYAQLLLDQLFQQLMRLYGLGARKIAVFGLGLLGCAPPQRKEAKSQGCVDSVNNIVQQFDNGLRQTIDSFNSLQNSAHITFINVTSILSGNPSALDVRVATTPCCKVSSTSKTGTCVPNSVPCSNRSEYAFWDNYHYTSILNQKIAARAYSAALPTDAYPVDIHHLVQQ